MTRVCLGDVANERKENCKTNEYNNHIVGLEHLIPQEVTLTQWAENIENTFTKVFHKGDVLFGRRRAYLKKAAVAPFDGICSGDITVIEAKPNKIVPELLPFIIQNDNLFDFAVEKSAGSLSPRVKWSHLQNYEFELPDLNKQRELAELLWAAEKTKQAYKKLLLQNDNIVKSKFEEMFGTENHPKNGTEFLKLGELASYINGCAFKPQDWEKQGLPIIRIQNLTGTSSEYNYFSGEYPKNAGVKKGDVLISWSASLGVYIWEGHDAILNQHIFKVVFDKKIINKDFFVYAVSQKLKELISKTHGSTMKHIVKKEFDNIKIAYPAIELQNNFASFAKTAEASNNYNNKTLNSIIDCTKSLIVQNLIKEVSHV